MKRIAITMVLLVSLITIMAGCMTDIATGEYQVLTFDISDSSGGAYQEREYSYWSDDVIDESNVRKNISIKVKGVEHQGAYRYATKLTPNSYPVYRYIDENSCYFSVDPDGRLTSYGWHGTFNTQDIQKKLSEEACLEVARDFLSEFVDCALYRVDTQYVSEQKLYTFNFTKYINNQKTADMASISVQENGELYSFSSFMLGKIPMTTPCDFDMVKVQAAIYEKLDTIYADEKETYDEVKYEIIDPYVTILENGEVALVCYVDVDCVKQIGEYFSSSGSRVGFVVE